MFYHRKLCNVLLQAASLVWTRDQYWIWLVKLLWMVLERKTDTSKCVQYTGPSSLGGGEQMMSHSPTCFCSTYEPPNSFYIFFLATRAQFAGSRFPDQGSNPGPPAVEVRSPNHRTIREFPNFYIFFLNGRKISKVFNDVWKFYEIPISVSVKFTATQPGSFVYR